MLTRLRGHQYRIIIPSIYISTLNRILFYARFGSFMLFSRSHYTRTNRPQTRSPDDVTTAQIESYPRTGSMATFTSLLPRDLGACSKIRLWYSESLSAGDLCMLYPESAVEPSTRSQFRHTTMIHLYVWGARNLRR
ncbi:hypothetical protein CC80DRAFT_167940 [Byssothecium circinans]|uniref:Uncharacterized protein n=1 Tax=Byssothecium circinans TaxID=147558 RepID=A0A6A5TVB0_9PLEO|nr:hypothetical protein CC80DRAFT_167940 [Byssothecium circinans]